ncbi:hypothetical protein V3481_003030 [Fusarium oxysporum f. sp. vasinfectum]
MINCCSQYSRESTSPAAHPHPVHSGEMNQAPLLVSGERAWLVHWTCCIRYGFSARAARFFLQRRLVETIGSSISIARSPFSSSCPAITGSLACCSLFIDRVFTTMNKVAQLMVPD